MAYTDEIVAALLGNVSVLPGLEADQELMAREADEQAQIRRILDVLAEPQEPETIPTQPQLTTGQKALAVGAGLGDILTNVARAKGARIPGTDFLSQFLAGIEQEQFARSETERRRREAERAGRQRAAVAELGIVRESGRQQARADIEARKIEAREREKEAARRFATARDAYKKGVSDAYDLSPDEAANAIAELEQQERERRFSDKDRDAFFKEWGLRLRERALTERRVPRTEAEKSQDRARRSVSQQITNATVFMGDVRPDGTFDLPQAGGGMRTYTLRSLLQDIEDLAFASGIQSEEDLKAIREEFRQKFVPIWTRKMREVTKGLETVPLPQETVFAPPE